MGAYSTPPFRGSRTGVPAREIPDGVQETHSALKRAPPRSGDMHLWMSPDSNLGSAIVGLCPYNRRTRVHLGPGNIGNPGARGPRIFPWTPSLHPKPHPPRTTLPPQSRWLPPRCWEVDRIQKPLDQNVLPPTRELCVCVC